MYLYELRMTHQLPNKDNVGECIWYGKITTCHNVIKSVSQVCQKNMCTHVMCHMSHNRWFKKKQPRLDFMPCGQIEFWNNGYPPGNKTNTSPKGSNLSRWFSGFFPVWWCYVLSLLWVGGNHLTVTATPRFGSNGLVLNSGLFYPKRGPKFMPFNHLP